MGTDSFFPVHYSLQDRISGIAVHEEFWLVLVQRVGVVNVGVDVGVGEARFRCKELQAGRRPT